LHFAYAAGAPVLQDLDAELRPGRLTALLGPNAAGKSTLLKLILSQLTPDGGSVEVDGQAVQQCSGAELARRLAYVPQRGGASFGFSVRQMVAMGRFAFGDERYVDEALASAGLWDLAGRSFNELSGGQQQRVLLARAWAQSRGPSGATPASAEEPFRGRGVLADEPAASLDLRHAHAALAQLRALAREGLAVLVVLHDPAMAERWADEVWLLDAGRLVASGSPAEVLTAETLGPVYGVELTTVEHEGRRLFRVEGPTRGDTADTLEG
jgi:iron complex transport system ATP-binding protein